MIKGIFRYEDLLSAQRVHMRPRRGLAIVGIALLALFSAVAVAVIVFPGNREPLWSQLLPVSVLALMAFWYWVLIPHQAKRTYRQRKDFLREYDYELSDTGLSVRSEHGQGIKPWADYLKWKEGNQLFLLYMSDNMYQIVPKRFFADETEISRFRETLLKNVPRVGV